MSDFMKMSQIVYICLNRDAISSPSSDILAMLLVTYIFIKWSEFKEHNDSDENVFAFLAMLCIWGITVKLSVACVGLFVIYPMYLIIKRKKWKSLFLYIVAGTTILLPWLIRNVITSGYLIYPYSRINLFDVDWKMLPSVLDYDKMEIVVWGRNVRKVALYNQPFSEWFVTWFLGNSVWSRVIIILGMIAAVAIIVYCFIKLIYKKKVDVLYYLVAICSLVFWLFTSPLMRYGVVYLLIPIFLFMSMIYNLWNKMIYSLLLYMIIPVLLFYFVQVGKFTDLSIIKQEDYRDYACNIAELNGISIFIPEEGDQGGYMCFPSTPNGKTLDFIQLRTTDLKDGFRIQCKYRNARITAYGSTFE